MSAAIAGKYLAYTLSEWSEPGVISQLDAVYAAGQITATEYAQIIAQRDKLFKAAWDARIAAGQTPQQIISSEDGQLLLGYRHGFSDAIDAAVEALKNTKFSSGSNWMGYLMLALMGLLILTKRG